MEKKSKKKPPPPLPQKALDLLARRRLSRGELKTKLIFRHYDPAGIETLLKKFEQRGFLNDESLALDYAQSRLQTSPLSKRKLVTELLKRRIPLELAQRATDQAYGETSEEQMANKACLLMKKGALTKFEIEKKLSRLGFSYDVIERVMVTNTANENEFE
jgi:SOS response regulatory protein OraA/RecX